MYPLDRFPPKMKCIPMSRGRFSFILLALTCLTLEPLVAFASDAVAAEQPQVTVTTAELGGLLVYPSRDAPADTVSMNDTRLDAEITGVLEEIPVQVGDRVSQGQIVARLDCGHHQIAVKSAVAAFDVGKSRHEFNEQQLTNARKLSTNRNISQEELDKRAADARMSKAELDRLESAIESARLTAEKCEIKAPFNGVVIERIASIGVYAVPGTPIVRLLDDENIEISAKVQEQDLESLTEADQLTFTSRGKSHPVRLRTVLPLMDSRLKTYEVRLTFVGERSSPGTTGRLSWVSRAGHVPADLIVRRGDALGIFVLDGDRVRFVALEHARPGHPAPIDLPASTVVVIDGRFVIQDGDTVRVQ